MEIRRCGTQVSSKGPTEYFTGNVRIDPLFQAVEPSRVSGAYAGHSNPVHVLLGISILSARP